MRMIDADALAEDLLYDAALCAIALDSGEIADHKELARLQFEKDCKQNCVYYISESPTVDAVPVVHATLEDMGLAEDDREWVCSNCKAEFTLCVCGKDRTGYIKHCPYCGAMIIGKCKGGDE